MSTTGGPAPAGYLGTDGRIDSGPAPELVEAGYGLEIADAPLLHDGLHLADLAHVLVLHEQGRIPDDAMVTLLSALLDLGEIPVQEFPYDVVLGDAYNSREKELSRRIGDVAGWVHLGRTRREAGRIAFRLAVRELVLDLAEATAAFTDALAERADAQAATLWADMTYLQPAQPSTVGHYLGSFAEEAARHLDRLRRAHAWFDISPAGSGGVAGTRLSLDRERLAHVLGFSEVGRNTRDTMWNIDGLIEVVTAAMQCVLTADRLAEDLEILASPPFGFVRLHGSLCRASVLMPQKRNPYALAVIRAGASTMVGRLTGVVTTARTPSGQTDNWLHSYGEVAGALTLARRLVALATAVVRGIELNEDALGRAARDQQAASTDIADEIVLRTGVDYRSAYRVVGRAIATALAQGTALSPQALASAAREVGVTVADLDLLDLDAVLDPDRLVASRTEPGGCAPHHVRSAMDRVRETVARERAWAARTRDAHARARADLAAAARDRLAGLTPD